MGTPQWIPVNNSWTIAVVLGRLDYGRRRKGGMIRKREEWGVNGKGHLRVARNPTAHTSQPNIISKNINII